MIFPPSWRTIMPSAPSSPPKPFRSWNKGKFIGPKSPLSPRYVWSIRARLQLDGKLRDLALFNLAIDSKLRGCDLVSLKVDDVAPNGYASSRATVRQRKTGRPVRFEITEQTRQTLDAYLRAQPKITELLSLSRSLGAGTLTDDTPVRSSGFRMGRDDWARSIQLRYAFPSPDKGNVDLPEDRKSPRGPAAARTFEDREHGSISRGRSGRRARHR